MHARAVRVARAFIEKKPVSVSSPSSRRAGLTGEARSAFGAGSVKNGHRESVSRCAPKSLFWSVERPIARPKKLRVKKCNVFSLSSDYTRTTDQMSLHCSARFFRLATDSQAASHPRSAKNSEAELESGTGVFSTSPTNSSAFPARFLKPALAFVAIAPRQRSRRRARVPRRCIVDPITLAFGSGRYSSRTRAA
jgi:hypothetical protein